MHHDRHNRATRNHPQILTNTRLKLPNVNGGNNNMQPKKYRHLQQYRCMSDIEMERIGSLNTVARPRRPNDIHLPRIPIKATDETYTPNTLSNGIKSPRLKRTSYEILTKEFQNLEKVSTRGSFAPKYTILPPIAGQPIKQNKTMSKYTLSADEKEKTLNENDEMEIKDEQQQRWTRASADPMQRTERKRASRRPTASYTNNGNTIWTNEIPPENNKDSTNEKESVIKQHTLQGDPFFSISVDRPDSPQVTTVPRPNTSLHSFNKQTQTQAEREFSKLMIKYVRYEGRRNAICFEIDEIYRDLAKIVKHNLLVQHLEDIWMY